MAEDPSKQLTEFTAAIESLNEKLSSSESNQAPQGFTVSPARIWGFIAGNLTLLGAITVFLWTSLTDVAEKAATDAANAKAAEVAEISTTHFLESNEEIQELAARVTEGLLDDVSRGLNRYREEERAIIKTLAEAKAAQEFLDRRGKELQASIEEESKAFETSTEKVLKQIRSGTEQLENLQAAIESQTYLEDLEHKSKALEAHSQVIQDNAANASAEVKAALDQLTAGMATLKRTSDELTEQLKQNILSDEALLERVAEGAANAFSEPGALDSVLVRHLERKIRNVDEKYDATRRAQALQLMSVFASEALLRDAITPILKDEPQKNANLLQIALQFYPPSESSEDNRAAVEAVLARIARGTPQKADLTASIERFISRLPPAQIPQLSAWLLELHPEPARQLAVDGLAQIGGDPAAQALLALVSKPDPTVAELGYQGLARIDATELSEDARRSAISIVWRDIERDVRAGESTNYWLKGLPAYLAAVAKAAKEGNLARLEQLTAIPSKSRMLRYSNRRLRLAVEYKQTDRVNSLAAQYLSDGFQKRVARGGGVNTVRRFSALANLLQTTDWEALTTEFWPGDVDSSAKGAMLGELLLAAWVRSLADTEPGDQTLVRLSDGTARQAWAIPGSLYRERLVNILEFSLQRGSDTVNAEFLRSFVSNFDPPDEAVDGGEFLGGKALAVAIGRDAEVKPVAYAAIHSLIAKSSTDAKDDLELAAVLVPAFEKHTKDAEVRKFILNTIEEDHPISDNWQTVVAAARAVRYSKAPETIEVLLAKFERVLTTPAGEHGDSSAEQNTGRQHKIAVLEALASTLFRTVGSSRDSPLQQQVLAAIQKHLESEERYDVKLASLPSSAQAAKALTNRGQRRLKDDPDAAESDLSIAIKLDPKNALGFKFMAMVHILRGEEQQAVEATERAVELAERPRAKAGALENLGLLFLRTGQWQAALDHSERVNALYDALSWNWLIRAIAAHELQLEVEEREAYEKWTSLKKPDARKALRKFIGEQMETYLSARG